MPPTLAIVGVLIFLAALLYSSVGHAGASGYLAVMGLCGVSAAVMKPTALTLNILVASIATVKFYRAGCFSWSLFWPFALPAVPAAFVGGAVTLPGSVYKPAVGVILLFVASRVLRAAPAASTTVTPGGPVPLPAALASGAAIGLLSGLTGTCGGIFPTPLLVLMGWADAKRSAGVSAAFILANSVAGLAGRLSSLAALPGAIPYWAVAAGLGGILGAEFGSRRLGNVTLRRLLAVFLVGTAPSDPEGHLNVSPKGLDTFRILGPHMVAYLDLTGSGIETVAHLRDNGRITIMFCAFEGRPLIVRLYGRGRVVEPGDGDWDGLIAHFPDYPGVRSVVVVDVERVADSCGYAVPTYEFRGERSQLIAYAENKGPEGMEEYQARKNTRSIDGLSGLRMGRGGERGPTEA